MVRRHIPCPVGSSSGELLVVWRKAIVPDPQLLAILLLNDEFLFLFAIAGPWLVFPP